MNLRAVIFDVYGTLLEVGPSPADAAARWEKLWRDALQSPPRLSLEQFSAACDAVIVREHLTAQARGIEHPEVYWPDVVREALPETGRLPAAARDDFLFAQSQLWHTVRLMPAVGETLRTLQAASVLIGIASNAQPYTIRELRVALAESGLAMNLFEPALCFWSFEHGFSKPDPHVFRLLSARLAARGITPGETLMVGDRLDNDLEPARACGWQTWLLGKSLSGSGAGHWQQLRQWLETGVLCEPE